MMLSVNLNSKQFSVSCKLNWKLVYLTRQKISNEFLKEKFCNDLLFLFGYRFTYALTYIYIYILPVERVFGYPQKVLFLMKEVKLHYDFIPEPHKIQVKPNTHT